MSVLKTSLANPSRMRGIFRYLLNAKEQTEKREVLERILSPDKLVEDKSTPRPMFTAALNQGHECKLWIKDNDKVTIHPDLPEDARNPQVGDKLLPDTFVALFFTSNNEDEEDFGRVCAWYLAQDIYDAPGNWEEVERQVDKQKVGGFLTMSNNALYSQMEDWMCYMGFVWGHALGGKRAIVPDPTAYLKRNLKYFFNEQQEILLKDFITRLGKRCPLFETGKFREEVEAKIGDRQPNYLSTSTAFALFKLKDEGYINLVLKSDANFMILPKANNQVDDDGRVSHIALLNGL